MYKQGHHGLNALLYTPIFLVVTQIWGIIMGVVGAVVFVGVSSVPDIDRHFDKRMNSHRSDIWHYIPIKHRGATHTIWFGIVLGGIGSQILLIMAEAYSPGTVSSTNAMIFGFMCGFGGICGHLLGDMVTPQGIAPFKPVSKRRYSLGLFTASNMIANYAFLIVGGGVLIVVIGWEAVEYANTVSETFSLQLSPLYRIVM